MVRKRGGVCKPNIPKGQAAGNAPESHGAGAQGSASANVASGSAELDNSKTANPSYEDMKVDALRAELRKRKLMTCVHPL